MANILKLKSINQNFFVCGHVHRSQQEEAKVGNTKVYNIAPKRSIILEI
jgi:Icc-related predicted phosphoesterase